MKKVIVVDWLDKYGGAERVIKSLDKVFNFEKCYTLANIMNKSDLSILFNNRKIPIETSWLQLFGKRFRTLLPLFPLFCNQIRIPDDTDLIISSSHAIAKSITNKNCLHISYFQARNCKYIWEEKDLYFFGFKSILKIFIPYLRRFDITSSKNPDFIISNSKFVQNWVQETYNRNSTVIYPPVDIHDFTLCEEKDDYYVTVGRLEQYKRFDLLVEAFTKNKKRLVVIGDGSQITLLKELAGSNIVFTGFLQKKEINEHISKAKAFVFAGLEDFGIAHVEAQACGTPVLCLNKGGTAETVIHNKTGLHFNNQTIEDINRVVIEFEENYNKFIPKIIRENAEHFSKERFENEIKSFVQEKYKFYCAQKKHK